MCYGRCVVIYVATNVKGDMIPNEAGVGQGQLRISFVFIDKFSRDISNCNSLFVMIKV